MADDRTDAEANAQDNDGAPLFTATTPTPRIANNNFISEADEELSRSLMSSVGYAYRDMRGNWWNIKWTGKAWAAYPLKATAAAYNKQYGTKMEPKRMYAASNNAADMITGIEERIEADRVEAKNSGGGIILVLILLAVLSKGKRR